MGIVDSVLELHALWVAQIGLSAKIFTPAEATNPVGERQDNRSLAPSVSDI
jgi:hypothetical protein